MRRVTFYGASDDLIEVEGDIQGADEYPGEEAIFEVGGLGVGVTFGSTTTGCWSITVGQIEEGAGSHVKVLEFGVRPRDGDSTPGYTMQLVLEVADDDEVVRIDQIGEL